MKCSYKFKFKLFQMLNRIGLGLLLLAVVSTQDVPVRKQHKVHYGSPPVILTDEETSASYWKAMAQDVLKDHLTRARQKGVAKNIILFLGDGMSIPTLAAARAYMGQMENRTGEDSKLSFENFPYTGFSKTYCVDKQVADSACTSTAYLCGVKANFGTIGVTAKVKRSQCEDGANVANHVSSIAKWAQDAGKATGIVTTTRVTHASPAGAYAHTANRDWESDLDVKGNISLCLDIATQLITNSVGSKFKVILGGGRREFLPNTKIDEEGAKGRRTDGVNLIDLWKSERRKHGNATYVWNKEQLESVDSSRTDYLLGLFEADHCQYNLDTIRTGAQNKEPSLSTMTHHALEMLAKEPNGYFLFVEGGRIDHAHHDNLAKKALDETVQLSAAIDMAVMMTDDSDTLIVVTSDHAHTLSYAGFAVRGHDILGVSNEKAGDGLPMSTLGYANGQGYKDHTIEAGGRVNLTTMDMKADNFKFPATTLLDSETHGGDDVGVFARGPWSHLFTGTYEQHLIPHIMAYASCIGDGAKVCETPPLTPAELLRNGII